MHSIPPTKEKGNFGEVLAARYLRAKGFVIIERNYQRRCGEIDIVTQQNDWLVFVEVKLRHGLYYWPHEAVDRAKQRKLIRTAESYLFQHHLWEKVFWRIDVVEILFQQGRAKMRHLENAVERPGQ